METATNDGFSFFVYAIVWVISILIVYYIVRDAVRDANKDLLNEMKIQNDLKIIEMKKQGSTE